MKIHQLLSLLIIGILTLSCSTSGSDSNPTGNETQLYDVTVSMSTSDGGTISPSADSSYEEGSQVSLLANPNDAYTFSGWTGTIDTTANPVTITVEKNYNLTANFQIKSYELTVNTTGEGNVTEQVIQQKTDYEHGTVVELTASPAKGWKFVEWTGDITGTNNLAEITVDDPKSVTAVFEKKSYALTINTSGEGAVGEEIIQAKATDYEFGTTIELTANPSTGWKFVEWQDDLSGSNNPEQITVDTAKTVTAVFEKKSYAVTVTTSGEGTVSKSPDQAEYDYNSTVELTANPSQGWQFLEWQGDVNSTANPLTVTVDTTKNITAVFENQYEWVIIDLQVEETYEYRELSSSPDEWYMYLNFEGVQPTDKSVFINFEMRFKDWQGDGSKDLYYFCAPNTASKDDAGYKKIDGNGADIQFECPNPAGDDFYVFVVTYHEMEASNIVAHQNQRN